MFCVSVLGHRLHDVESSSEYKPFVHEANNTRSGHNERVFQVMLGAC